MRAGLDERGPFCGYYYNPNQGVFVPSYLVPVYPIMQQQYAMVALEESGIDMWHKARSVALPDGQQEAAAAAYHERAQRVRDIYHHNMQQQYLMSQYPPSFIAPYDTISAEQHIEEAFRTLEEMNKRIGEAYLRHDQLLWQLHEQHRIVMETCLLPHKKQKKEDHDKEIEEAQLHLQDEMKKYDKDKGLHLSCIMSMLGQHEFELAKTIRLGNKKQQRNRLINEIDALQGQIATFKLQMRREREELKNKHRRTLQDCHDKNSLKRAHLHFQFCRGKVERTRWAEITQCREQILGIKKKIIALYKSPEVPAEVEN